MRITWFAQVLRNAGLTVVEHDGWKTRGWSDWDPDYGIVHATAAPRTQSDADQVRIVRDGHSSLQGPIANCCVDRQGRWHVLASGRCNTALVGWGGPARGLGNTYLLGVEACNDNGLHQPPELWPAAQYEAYARGWAAIAVKMRWPASRVVGHKEHQPGDKSDPRFDMGKFRKRIAEIMEGDDVSAKELWSGDKLIVKRHDDGKGSKPTTPADALSWMWYHQVEDTRDTRELAEGQERIETKQDAILAAVAGQNVVGAVEAKLVEHRELMLTRFSQLLAGLPAAVSEELGDRDTEAVTAAVERAVAKIRVSVSDG